MSSVLSSVFVVVVCAIAQADGAPAVGGAGASRNETGATAPDVSSSSGSDEIAAAVAQLMSAAREPARVAVLPVDDRDGARGAAIERAIVGALRDRGREEVLTPASVKRTIADAAASTAPTQLAPLAADHVVVGAVVDAAGAPEVRLKLLLVQTGEVLAEARAPAGGAAAATTAKASTVRGAIAKLVDDVAWGVEAGQGDARYVRVAVAPLAAQGEAAVASRLDRYLQAELTDGLRERGFLVVERARLNAAIEQIALGQALGEDAAPQVGKLAGADVVVVGAVAEAGASFVVSARAVSTTTGQVVGAGGAEIPRDDVIVVASGAAETKSAGEAVFRSLVAPGWGQAYNGEIGKSVFFAVAGYGAGLATIGLGVGALASWAAYGGYAGDVPPGSTATPGDVALALRRQTDVLLVGTGVAAAVALTAWAAGAVDAWFVGRAIEEGA